MAAWPRESGDGRTGSGHVMGMEGTHFAGGLLSEWGKRHQREF